MARRKHPQTLEAPPQSVNRRRNPPSVNDVLQALEGVPTVRGEARERIRAYLTEKHERHPEWWAQQHMAHLVSLAQIFGVKYGS